ncbi:RnfABCDGE type electron transport complex subunit D [Martelella radicis]|uniref:Na+-transporting NADH:ubiquinone oxidoreductase subunit B n=1 Tax=Martelella radicis TaxID=1397476 RepID=A0A7W6KN22_9HYPH|nr:RnfABCDGE type electron transport complex subunit D [Martelella radicis]MBB4124276.1 Na+-transporting NADH:ubiquinone oxidoreductase subunit B [Martelella radicis]
MNHGLWDRETVALLLLISVMPLALTWLWYGGLDAAGLLVLALIISGLWHVIFMLARAQPPSFAGALTALAIAMLAPEDLSILQLVLGISFGSVMAELVFGGWGRNVLNPATVTLAFLGFGFVTAPWPEPPLPLAWAAIPAALLGALFGVMPARVIAGAVIVIGGAHLAGLPVAPAFPAIAVVLVLLVADPVASASTKLGGWLNGAFFGAMIILFTLGWQSAAHVQLAVSAALLTSLAAPLLDEAAIALWLAQRRRRHG